MPNINSDAVNTIVQEMQKIADRTIGLAPFASYSKGIVVKVLENSKYVVNVNGTEYTVPSCVTDGFLVNDVVLVLFNGVNNRQGYVIGKSNAKKTDASSVGDMLKSVYDSNNDGKVDFAENADKVGGHTVGKSVPSDAVFTDTVYTHPSTHSADIIIDGANNKVYTSDEKTKLSNISLGANKVEKSTTNGNIKINDVETSVYSHPTGTNPHGITKEDVGLGSVNNTSDVNKPISTATQDALNLKANADDLTSHTGNNTSHITSIERTNWNKAFFNNHIHSNKNILDSTTASFTTEEKDKIAGVASGAQVNVKSDWNATGGDAQILNKPTTVAGYGITDAYTKSEIDNKVAAVYKYQGSVSTYGNLPTSGMEIGYVYNVIDTGKNYAWDGTVWDDIGGTEPLATSSNNGLMSKEDFSKLSGITIGATKNDTDENLKNRANHTGTQVASTISDFAAAVKNTVLTGLSVVTNTAIDATDTVLSALGKLQKQITDHLGDTIKHITSTERDNWNFAHSNSHTHSNKSVLDATTASFLSTEKTKLSDISTGANKTQNSTINGNILIDGTETNVYTHPTGTNPHKTTKFDVGLGNVDNESKSTMFSSPAFTGTPTAPTPTGGTNTSQIATTAFVQNALSSGGYGDMLKSVYDADNDGKVDNAKNADTLGGKQASDFISKSGNSTVSGSLSVDRYFQNATGVPTSNLGSPTVTEMALFESQFNNKLWFYDPSKFVFEYTNDGTSWITQSISIDIIKNFISGNSNANIQIPRDCLGYRITIRNAGSYVYLNCLYMYWSSSGNSTAVAIQKKRDDGSWIDHTSSTIKIGSWPGHLYLPFNTIPWSLSSTSNHYHEVRIIFTPTWNESYTNPITLYGLELWGGYPSGKRTIYSWDSSRNVTYPAELKASTFKKSDGSEVAYSKDIPNITVSSSSPSSPKSGDFWMKIV